MSKIDVQNSRQIRDPMDVLITLSLGTDIAMTYSGYSSAKVADGVLNQSSWPMRGLADLQGNGFPLDGSRVLYNPNTSPSQTNGKLGVRGNVGQPVSVTATGNDTIAALAISVTGAASVTLSGRTTEITGSRVTLQLLNTTAALTFQPSSEDRRVEVAMVQPEAGFIINNDNLIKATVSLRSDLSPFDQTLPESELNVEVYQDNDVSEAVASIPEDTPITYQAGYPGDMSPVRKFYVSGQVTWAGNVLKIQAVDAVHLLDRLVITPPIRITDARYIYWNSLLGNFSQAGVSVIDDGWGIWGGDEALCLLKEQMAFRDYLAFLNQCLNITDPEGKLLDGSWTARRVIQFAYVDAGIPRFSMDSKKRTHGVTVREEDCAEIKVNHARRVTEISAEHTVLKDTSAGASKLEDGAIKVGSATWTKNVGASLNFDERSYFWSIGLFVGFDNNNETAQKLIQKYGTFFDWLHTFPAVPGDTYGTQSGYGVSTESGSAFAFGQIPQEKFLDDRYPGSYPYSTFVPWNQRIDYEETVGGRNITTQAQMWKALVDAKIIDSTAPNIDLDIYGHAFIKKNNPIIKASISGDGTSYEYPELMILGVLNGEDENYVSHEIFPSKMLAAPLYRSNVTCSFTWKGDPRIQPRDVFTFHRLDGTDEEWTFENITITHEGGGTLAEVTARKGIV